MESCAFTRYLTSPSITWCMTVYFIARIYWLIHIDKMLSRARRSRENCKTDFVIFKYDVKILHYGNYHTAKKKRDREIKWEDKKRVVEKFCLFVFNFQEITRLNFDRFPFALRSNCTVFKYIGLCSVTHRKVNIILLWEWLSLASLHIYYTIYKYVQTYLLTYSFAFLSLQRER